MQSPHQQDSSPQAALLDRLRAGLESYSQEAADLRHKVSQLQDEVVSLQSSAQEAKQLEEALEQLEQQVDDERAEWHRTQDSLTGQASRLDHAMQQLESENAQLKHDNQAAHAMTASLEKELSRVRREHAADRAEWNSTKSDLHEQLKSASSQIEQLTRASGSASSANAERIAALEQELDDRQSKIRHLREQLDEQTRRREEAGRLAVDAQKATESLQSVVQQSLFHAQACNLYDEVSNIATELPTTVKQLVEDLGRYQSMHAKLQAQVEQSRSTVIRLETQQADERSKFEVSIQQARKDLTGCRQQLEQALKRNDDARESSFKYEQELRELRQHLNDTRLEIMDSKAAATESKNDARAALIAATKASNSRVVQQLRSVSSRDLQEANSCIHGLRKTIGHLEDRLHSTKVEYGREVDDLRREVESLQGQLKLYKQVDVYSLTLQRAIRG